MPTSCLMTKMPVIMALGDVYFCFCINTAIFLFGLYFAEPMGFKELIRKLRPLSEDEKKALGLIKEILSEKRFDLVKQLLKLKKISLAIHTLNIPFFEPEEYVQVMPLEKKVDAKDVNNELRRRSEKKIFEKFSKRAFELIPNYIAPNLVGMGHVKQAVVLQMFAKQPVHILLLGDPGTGKTDVLRSAFNLTPVSSFGLGSGTSGAGLVVTVKGDDIQKGLLPLADNGLCCIDELNLMKEENRAGLYNAMEKGFVTYDKGGHHFRFDARVKVLSTANPIGDEFSGKKLDELKKQMPFDSALLSRFHLLFLIRKPDLKKFKKIAEKIAEQKKTELSQEESNFIKDYIEYADRIDVRDISKSLQNKIVDIITEIKKNEGKYLIEVSPRIIIGFMRLCKALAKMNLRDEVSDEDINIVKEILRKSLEVD